MAHGKTSRRQAGDTAIIGSGTKVRGRVNGAGMERGKCVVEVEVISSKADRFCPLRLRASQLIKLTTTLSSEDCPQDEGPVIGVVSAGTGSSG